MDVLIMFLWMLLVALDVKWAIDDCQKQKYFGTGLWVACLIMHGTLLVRHLLRVMEMI